VVKLQHRFVVGTSFSLVLLILSLVLAVAPDFKVSVLAFAGIGAAFLLESKFGSSKSYLKSFIWRRSDRRDEVLRKAHQVWLRAHGRDRFSFAKMRLMGIAFADRMRRSATYWKFQSR
jgi:hypothetical protein